MFATLKPLGERKLSADQVIARLRPKLAQVAGANLFMQAVQDIRVGGRQGNSQYQFTLQSDSLSDLYTWGPKLLEALRKDPSVITDVDSDQQQHGLQVNLTIDRDAAARLGVNTRSISSTLYDAFGQRQVSTIYNALNQYHVVMEVSPEYWENPESLKDIYVSTRAARSAARRRPRAIVSTAPLGGGRASIRRRRCATSSPTRSPSAAAARRSTGAAVSTAPETMIPLSSVTRYDFGTTPLAVNHQGLFVASTISFNLAPGKTLSDAVAYRERDHARDRPAVDHPRLLPGHGAGLPGFAQQPAPAGAGGARRRLYRAGHPLRELHPPDHDPVDPAVGRHRRAAGAQADGRGVQHHRHDRRAAAGRHRQEERHHDDRRGAGARAQRGARAAAWRSTRRRSCASARS